MKKKSLDSIEVKSPCGESWDEMIGNDEVRFCSHCAKKVHNLSAMTRRKAEQLVKKSNGKLCVRYVKTPQGKLITAPPQLAQITRRATIAASVLATTLSLSTMTYAQGEPIVKKDNSIQTTKDKSKKDETKQTLAIISGEVRDAQGAVIPGAKVTLRDIKTNKIRQAQTNADGSYQFKDVEPNIYELVVKRIGFKNSVYQNIEVLKDTKLEKILVLEVGEATIGVVDIVKEPPVETESPKPSKQIIEQRPLVELPQLTQNFTMGYLIKDLPANSRNILELLKLKPVKQLLSIPENKKKKKKN